MSSIPCVSASSSLVLVTGADDFEKLLEAVKDAYLSERSSIQGAEPWELRKYELLTQILNRLGNLASRGAEDFVQELREGDITISSSEALIREDQRRGEGGKPIPPEPGAFDITFSLESQEQ